MSLRLFAGIPVPEPALTELGGILEALKLRDWPVRWVRREGLHLTLKFYGSVPAEKEAPLVEALAQAAEGVGPIPISCTTMGAFPNGARARILWIGLEAPGSLELLQDRVERGAVPLGFPVEGRPFRPHITIGRVREGARLGPDVGRLLDQKLEIPFLGEQLVLFESRPGKGGSVYTPRHRIDLTPCAAV